VSGPTAFLVAERLWPRRRGDPGRSRQERVGRGYEGGAGAKLLV